MLIALAGFALIVYLSTNGFDSAVLLIPTWFLLVVWVVAAGMTVAGSSPTTSSARRCSAASC